MKILLATLAFLSTTAFAVTAPTITAQVNLDEIINNRGKSMGIHGMLPVSIDAEASEASLAFNKFVKVESCIDEGEPEIPHHPETAPCYQWETSWVPEAVLKVKTIKIVMDVGGKKLAQTFDKTFSLSSECLVNREAATVVSATGPTEAPAELKLKASCLSFNYDRIEERNVRPAALKGAKMEAIVDLSLNLTYSAETEITLTKDEKVQVTISDLKSVVSGMNDFGGFKTGVFKYYDRAFFK